MTRYACHPRRTGHGRIATLIAIAVAVLSSSCESTLSGSQAPDSNANLVVNPGFEQAGGMVGAGWTFEARASNKGRAARAGDRPHGGGFGLKLEPNDRNRPWDIANNPLSAGQAFPAGPLRGKTLYFSAWLAADGTARAVAALYALRRDGGVTFERLEQSSSGRDPAFHETTFTVPDDGNVQYVILNCAVEGTEGAAYFDDIVVRVDAGGATRTAVASQSTGPLNAEITIEAARHIRRIPRLLFGTNIEWIWDANGMWDPQRRTLTPDIVRLTRDTGISILRFPGGVFADFYHWRDGVGPREQRRETVHTPGGPRSVHHFGTDEALAFAGETGSELLITVNAGTGTPEEAAEWVRYVNGGRRTPRVNYWEIGNELYIKDPKFVSITPPVYRQRVQAFAKAMRAADPTIKIGAISDENYGRIAQRNYQQWTEEVLRGAGLDIDFLAVHNAYAPMLFEDKGWDARTVYAAMLAAPQLIKTSLSELSRRIDTLVPDRQSRIAIAVTEWGPFFHFDLKNRFVDHVKTLGSALFTASALKVFIESPRVEVANAFKLTDPLFMGWIGQRNGQFAATAPLLALQMFTRHFGENLIESATRSPTYDSPAVGWVNAQRDVPYLDAIASRSADGQTLYVLAINKHFDQPVQTRIAVRGFQPAGDAVAWVLNGTAIDANTGTRPVAAAGAAQQAAFEPGRRFDRGAPGEITFGQSTVRIAGSTFDYTFPAHSITALEIKGR